MDTELERRALELTESALAQPASRRDEFVRHIYPDELRTYVIKLLRRAENDEFPAWPASATGDDTAPSPSNPNPQLHGQVIGAYRILETIGHGGMGAVYSAVRADGAFTRTVALKLVNRTVAGPDFTKRFEDERKILAQLDHPNIARLYDGGTTSQGEPYLVMECVSDGLPVDQYCTTHGLGVERILELFLQACSAVEHAHERLIVHLDLKPSNMLVAPDGSLKLLDFGIAKVLQPTSTVSTGSGAQLMTPDYASPEQARGQPITVGSDVYSLGTVFYLLLSGLHPRHVPHAPTQLPMGSEAPPPPPPSKAASRRPASDAGSRRALSKRRRRLKGDLDHIVLKAMQEDPGSRYPSVHEFASDIRRHLDHLPVSARPNTLAYRTGKLVRRRASPLAMLLALVTFLGAAAFREWSLSTQAAQERDKAQEVSNFLKGLFEDADPSIAMDRRTVLEVVDRGAQRIGELKGRPELQATYLETVGSVYRSLGRYDQARLLQERALNIRHSLYGREHPDVAESLDDIGETLYHSGDLKGAESYYQRALEMRRDILGARHPELAESESNLGVLQGDVGNYDVAEHLLRDALRVYEDHYGQDHPFTASTLNNLAAVLQDKGDLKSAERYYEDVARVQIRLYGPTSAPLATTLNNLATLHADKEEYEAAERNYRQALAMRQAHLDDAPSRRPAVQERARFHLAVAGRSRRS